MSGPQSVDPAQAERIIQMVGQQIMGDLQVLYPLDKPADLEQVALGTAMDQVAHLGPMFKACTDPRIERIGLTLTRPATIAGAPDQELKFAAPRTIAQCKTLNEVLSCATVYALLLAPSARAVIARDGYRLKFLADGAHLKEGEVIRVDFNAKKKDDGEG